VNEITRKWIRNKADEIAVSNGCYFSEEAANHAKDFMEGYLYIKPKKKFKLYDWQWEKIVAPVFGWIQEDGTRRFRVAYIEVPKKNGKSLIISACLLYLLIADGEFGAEIYVAAYNRDQAKVIFNEICKLVRNSPKLDADKGGACEIKETTNTIVFPHTQSFLRVLSRDAHSSEGKNASALGFDEVHTQKTRDLWDALRYSGSARRQPLILAITTAGYDKQSVCWELHQQAINVNSGLTPQDDFYGVIFAADEGDDPFSETTWKKANPSYGLSLNPKDFKSAAEEARQSPAKLNAFKRYRLCLWTENETKWITEDKWAACRDNFTADELLSKACYLAVDLSISTAFTAVVLCFPFDNGTYKLLPYFFLPSETIEDMRGRLPYDLWKTQGYIIEQEGSVIDYDKVRAFINELGRKYAIQQVGFDPFNSQNFESQLKKDNFDVYKIPQVYSTMSPPSKEFERLILNGKIRHNGNPVLDWMISCTTIKTDEQANIKPVKPDRNKTANQTDGVIASIMALALSIWKQGDTNKQTKSVYEKRGLLAF